LNDKKNTIKNSISKNTLLIVGVLLAVFVLETFFRFTEFNPSLMQPVVAPQGYFKKDVHAGYDLTDNFSTQKFVFHDSEHPVWTNEIGCFDDSYRGEKDYILLAGDSAVWGYARFEDKFGTLIEKLLGMRVVKCGVTDYGTRQQLLKIKKVLQRVGHPPKLIILGYFIENDFMDDWLFPNNTVINGWLVRQRGFDMRVRKKYYISEDKLIEMERNLRKHGDINGRVSFIKKIRKWLGRYSALYHVIAGSRLVKVVARKFGLLSEKVKGPERGLMEYLYQSGSQEKFDDEWLQHFGNLREIKEVADECEAKLLILLIPSKHLIYGFLNPSYSQRYMFHDVGNMLNDYFMGEDVFFLDFVSVFKEYADLSPRKHLDSRRDLYWRHDWHWNAKGNRLAAFLITDFIVRNNLIEIGERGKREEITRKVKEGLSEFRAQ